MIVDYTSLGRSAQEQIDKKTGARKRPRENKTHAQKVTIQTYDGRRMTFASGREARRYKELEVLQRAGEITDLRVQQRFELVPRQRHPGGKKEQSVDYVADFVYRDSDGALHVEDAKGLRDPGNAIYRIFVIKRKLMLWVHGITVEEV